MSHYSIDSVDDAPLLDPVTFNWDLRLYRSFVLAGLVLLIYDHTLTLATEVKFIWAAKLRPSIYWFLALRYIGLVANIANCVLYFAELNHKLRQNATHVERAHREPGDTSRMCAKPHHQSDHNRVLIRVKFEATLIMRVFAMYDRNRWILICLLAVFTPWPVLALWDVIEEGQPQIFSGPEISGCATVGPRTSTFRLAGAWEAQIACDILVFLLTVRRAYVQREAYPRYAGTLLCRMTTDGAWYFGIIIIANAANLVTFYLGDMFITGFLSWFITSLSITLLARLMLNLHKAAAVGMEEPSTIELETLRFATVQMTSCGGRHLALASAITHHIRRNKPRLVSLLVDKWNHHFFHPRNIEVILMRGQVKLSGQSDQPVANLYTPRTVNFKLPPLEDATSDGKSPPAAKGGSARGHGSGNADKTYRLFMVSMEA
ncbi:hypothetical protein B0H14DRAFT_3127663 [Mycena olivaceomarginata]|nr:hypothetical protein B0H14DRAFT_3127663 [Mycena olivaceomarginata]